MPTPQYNNEELEKLEQGAERKVNALAEVSFDILKSNLELVDLDEYRSLRFCYVEDDPDYRKLGEMWAQIGELKNFTSLCGEEDELLDPNHWEEFDIIILDVHIPLPLDKILDAIKKAKNSPQVLFVSAHTKAPFIRGFPLLEKPVDFEQIKVYLGALYLRAKMKEDY